MAELASDCTVSEAASLLGVSRVTVWRWIRDGKIQAERLGHRTVRIRRTDLNRLMSPDNVRSAHRQPLGLGAAEIHDPRAIGAGDHIVQFYESETTLLEAVGDRFVEAINLGQAAVAIATPPHQ